MKDTDLDEGAVGILYVEDEPETREIVAEALREDYPQHQLYVASDGAEGLALFREYRPEVVITDIRMPVMDGVRMAEEIRAIEPDAELIALTAYSDTSFLVSAIETGFSHYVLKPVDVDKLFAALDKSLLVVLLKRRVHLQHERLRRFSSELEVKSARLEEANHELAAFNHTVAHDLRGSLNTIGLSFQSVLELEGKQLSESARRFLENGRERSRRMGVLIDTLLQFSETSHTEPRREEVDLSALVRSVADELTGADPERRHEFLIAEGIRVNGDPKLLRGEIAGAVIVNQDISDLKQTERELRAARDQLEARVYEQTEELRNALKKLGEESAERLQTVEELRRKEQLLMQQSRLAAMGEMLVNISHQWRQPLNVLGLILQELVRSHRRGSFSAEYLEARVARGRELIAHMSQTIDDFRNFLNPEKIRRPFSVKEAVEGTLAIVRDSLRDVRVEVRAPGEEDVVIDGFRNEFAQAVMNILLNARDVFRERKVPDPRLTVTLFREAGRSVVTFADNGGGIAPEVIDKIFEPYFTTKEPDKGTGIGLFMTKMIIERNMRGRLSVRNTAEGAELRIEV